MIVFAVRNAMSASNILHTTYFSEINVFLNRFKFKKWFGQELAVSVAYTQLNPIFSTFYKFLFFNRKLRYCVVSLGH
jgi:hypothetical protein